MSGRPCNGLNHFSSFVLTSEVGENEEMASPTLWSTGWFMETKVLLWKHKPEPEPDPESEPGHDQEPEPNSEPEPDPEPEPD